MRLCFGASDGKNYISTGLLCLSMGVCQYRGVRGGHGPSSRWNWGDTWALE